MTSYKLTLPCTRDEAEILSQSESADLGVAENPPVIVTSEPDPNRPDIWEVCAYYETEPQTADIECLRHCVPSAEGREYMLEKLGNEDWLSMSQEGLEPIRAGRFHVHTPHMPADNSDALQNFCIDAGLAFGTGHHETTYGCLAMLDDMRELGVQSENMLDLGTGTGLLAFAAGYLWPQSRLTASDIDPVCQTVVKDNARQNRVKLGKERGQLHMLIADGMDDPDLRQRGPYDLITANILAGPLIDMAGDIADAIVPEGNLVLAGLLNEQAESVMRAYSEHGMQLFKSIVRGGWTILWLRKHAP